MELEQSVMCLYYVTAVYDALYYSSLRVDRAGAAARGRAKGLGFGISQLGVSSAQMTIRVLAIV